VGATRRGVKKIFGGARAAAPGEVKIFCGNARRVCLIAFFSKKTVSALIRFFHLDAAAGRAL